MSASFSLISIPIILLATVTAFTSRHATNFLLCDTAMAFYFLIRELIEMWVPFLGGLNVCPRPSPRRLALRGVSVAVGTRHRLRRRRLRRRRGDQRDREGLRGVPLPQKGKKTQAVVCDQTHVTCCN